MRQMTAVELAAGIRRRLAGLRTGATALRNDRRGMRSATDPDVAAGVVRAAYVAVLRREPDPDGLSTHSARVMRGLPLESLLAELARARDAEGLSEGEDSRREAREAAELASLWELVYAQRQTMRALARRLAAIEDRLPVDAPQDSSTLPEAD